MQHATIMTMPPSSAENAPWAPSQKPAPTAITTVTRNCSRRTRRKGLFWKVCGNSPPTRLIHVNTLIVLTSVARRQTVLHCSMASSPVETRQNCIKLAQVRVLNNQRALTLVARLYLYFGSQFLCQVFL